MERQSTPKSSKPERQGEAPVSNTAAAKQTLHPIIQLQRMIGNRAASSFIQAKLKVSEPGDAPEQEADRVAQQVMRMPDPALSRSPIDGRQTSGILIQRACAECEEELHRQPLEEEDEEKKSLQRKESSETAPQVTPNVQTRIDSPRGGGQPLPESARAFFEPRFGYDFSRVRVHTGPAAEGSATSVKARAFTIGSDIVFGPGQYAPTSSDGNRLLAHELTHVLQQANHPALHNTGEQAVEKTGSADTVQRSVTAAGDANEPPQVGERRPDSQGYIAVTPPPRPAALPRPETCPPPVDMICLPATTSPGFVTNSLTFPQNIAILNPRQVAEVDAAAASWHAAGGSVTARIDGFASAEGECGYNWDLSCRRARAVGSELASPRDGTPGVPSSNIELIAHGENDEFGPGLGPNRKATISIPTLPPRPPPPACALPKSFGSARGCGSGTDFTNFDFPAISTWAEAKLAAWAAARPLSPGPFRSLVTDWECEVEMDAVLTGLAGSAGHAAFSRFAAGTGGTAPHGPTSTLGAMALISTSFLATVALVKTAIEAQLAVQAAAGALDPCALSIIPPATFFGFGDGVALKTVIGGTQGEELIATAFTGDILTRSYSIDLRFLICDDFGVDEADLYSWGLFAFWVLQHERSPSRYIPFINQLDLPVTVSGTF